MTTAAHPATNPELRFEGTQSNGAAGPAVRRVQEWLTLNRIGVKIDGRFGAATETAVRALQAARNLAPSGIVDEPTFQALIGPMATAVTPVASTGSFGRDVVACAEQHVAQHPREVGGANRGPWVRLYMDGEEGSEWPWCGGFARFLMRQASQGRALPFNASVSCDEMARGARQRGLFHDGTSVTAAEITPGSLFLVRRAGGQGWHHTGIVVQASDHSMVTIEGNTNDDGSREGYEAIKRVRGAAGLDFVIFPN